MGITWETDETKRANAKVIPGIEAFQLKKQPLETIKDQIQKADKAVKVVTENGKTGIKTRIGAWLTGITFVLLVADSAIVGTTNACAAEYAALEASIRHLNEHKDQLSCFDAVDKMFDYLECRGNGITDNSGLGLERREMYNRCAGHFNSSDGARYYWVPGKVGPLPDQGVTPEVAKCVLTE